MNISDSYLVLHTQSPFSSDYSMTYTAMYNANYICYTEQQHIKATLICKPFYLPKSVLSVCSIDPKDMNYTQCTGSQTHQLPLPLHSNQAIVTAIPGPVLNGITLTVNFCIEITLHIHFRMYLEYF